MLSTRRNGPPLTTEPSLSEADLPLEPTPTPNALAAYVPPEKSFSSLKPDHNLIWAFVDNSSPEHQDAVDIIYGLQSRPPREPQVCPPVQLKGADKPAGPTLELNAQYEAWVRDPVAEVGNLVLAIDSFARTDWRKAAAWKLLNTTTNGDEADDILSEFCLYLVDELELGHYEHSGNFDGWIASTWEKRFLQKKKRELYKYTSRHRFVNDDSDSNDYEQSASCVRITSDLGVTRTDRKRNGDSCITEAGSPHKRTDAILRDLDNPNTKFGQLDADTRQILKGVSRDMTHEEIAKELGCCVRTIGRKLEEVKVRFNPGDTSEAVAVSQ